MTAAAHAPWVAATVAALAALAVIVAATVARPQPSARAVEPAASPWTSSGRRRSRTAANGHAGIADANALTDLLDEIARDVRVGASLPAAVDLALARHPSCVQPLGRLLRAGSTLPAALAAVAGDAPPATIVRPARRGRSPSADERLVVQTLLACCRSGGQLAAPLERAAMVLRERRAWQQERHAQSAQARLSALVMTLLPVGFAAWGAVSSASVREAYARSPAAVVCGVVGLVLNSLGWWWMRHLVRGGSG